MVREARASAGAGGGAPHKKPANSKRSSRTVNTTRNRCGIVVRRFFILMVVGLGQGAALRFFVSRSDSQVVGSINTTTVAARHFWSRRGASDEYTGKGQGRGKEILVE